MRTSSTGAGFAMLLLAAVAGHAQQPAPASSLKVNLPPDSPVSLISAGWGDSRTSERGSALVIDLSTALTLRNSSQRRIVGYTWMVLSQEMTPGGRASVTRPILNIAPGDVFPVRIDLQLLRPIGRVAGPLVEVSLDGILFDDLSFYGPNKLDSRRSMTALELEARRDRQWFKQVLASRGADGLREECIASLARQANAPQLDVRLARSRATNVDGDHEVKFSFLRFPDAPVEPLAGMAHVTGSEAQAPKLEVINRSTHPVRYLEMGWLIRDNRGREFQAAVPAAIQVAPGQKAEVLGDSSLRFTDPSGGRFLINSMTGFVNQVEFSDGTVWVPSHASLEDPALRKALLPSVEEMRLTTIYKRKGLAALVEELKKF